MPVYEIKINRRVGFSLIMGCIILLCAALNVYAVTYTYDNAGRLTQADYGSGQILTYAYDPGGNVIETVIETLSNRLLVNISPSGAGTVTGNGINCPGDCEESFDSSPAVSLTANPATGYTFLRWTGDTIGTVSPTSIVMDDDKNCLAYFVKTDGSTDNDNLPDTTEMGASGTDYAYDGNGNGVPDYQEAEAASLSTSIGGAYATLSVPTGYTLTSVQSVGNPSPGDVPADTAFPYGFFSFNVTGLTAGQCVDVQLFLPLNNAISSYYRYGPEPGIPAHHWYDFNYDGTTGAEIYHESDRTRIVLHFCDALRGDDNPVEDSMIIDAGGPSTVAAAEADIHVSPKSFYLESIGTGGSATANVTVTNQGGGTLYLGTVAGTDPLEAPFAITSDSCTGASLTNSATCTISITFTPTIKGRFSDSFTIPSDDAGETPVTVYVNGSSQKPAPNIPDIMITPTILIFGGTPITSSSARTVLISNFGTSNLIIGNIASANSLQIPYTIPSDTCSGQTIPPGENCLLDVIFIPEDTNSHSDSFDIPSNDPWAPSITIVVWGYGMQQMNTKFPWTMFLPAITGEEQ